MKDKQEVKESKGKTTNTAFFLMFPSFIVAVIAALFAPVWGSIIAIALSIYQFIMLKKFVEDYYKK